MNEEREQGRQLRLNPRDKNLDELGDDKESQVFIMEMDGTKEGKPTSYGISNFVLFRDANTKELRVAFLKKEKPGYTNVYGKNLIEVWDMLKKGDSFTIKRVKKQSKKGFSFVEYHIKKLDISESPQVKKAIAYAKEHGMNRLQVEELCDKVEASPDERQAILNGATWQN